MAETSPFHKAAASHQLRGWYPFPLPGVAKSPPPDGLTGYDGRWITKEMVDEWRRTTPRPANIGIRMPDTVLGIDVDCYAGKKGAQTLSKALQRLGELPATYRLTSRTDGSQKLFYRVPAGRQWQPELGPGVEILSWHHRYAMSAPSVNPDHDDQVVGWYAPTDDPTSPDRTPLALCPNTDDLPDLPAKWVKELDRGPASERKAKRATNTAEVQAFLDGLPGGVMCKAITPKLATALENLADGRHNAARDGTLAILAVANFGHTGGRDALDQLHQAFIAAASDGARNGDAEAEWGRLVTGAVAMIDPCDERSCCPSATTGPAQTVGTGRGDQFDGAGEGLSDGMLCATVARDVLAGRYRWCKGMGWLTWTGQRWKPTPDQAVMEEVRRYLLAQWREALRQLGQATTDEQRKALESLVGAWRGTLNKGRIGAVTALAQGIGGVLTEVDALDSHPDLLNAGNGVVDLRTGTLAEHDPGLLLTKITEVDYRPEVEHPDWTAALGAVPTDRRVWLQRRLGQGITGYMTPDDVMIVIDGGGENGKTTVAVGIRGALGDYFTLISHRALLGDPSQHPTELMSFRGARVAFLEELPEERRLSVTRLKSLVGTPTMKARLIRQDEIEFECTHSLFLNTNHLPVVDETDHGTWRRLARLRFPYTFRKPSEPVGGPNERRGDPNLRQRLQEGRDKQHEAVLAWLVAGAVAWYKDNRVMPAAPVSVVSDTKAWRGKSDLLLAYAADRLIFEPDSHVISTELLADFNEWLKAHGHREWSDRTLAGRIEDHGEFIARDVEKKAIRKSDKLSRRPASEWATPKAPPGMYKAWLGLRFRHPNDDWPAEGATL